MQTDQDPVILFSLTSLLHSNTELPLPVCKQRNISCWCYITHINSVLNGFAGYHMSEAERFKHESWKIKIETTNSEGESREQRYEIKIQRRWRKCWWGFREQQWTSASCGSPSRGSFVAGWLTALLSNSINALLLSGNKSCGCLSIQMQQDCTLAIHPNKTHIWQNLLYS